MMAPAQEERKILALYLLTDLLLYWVALSVATTTRWDGLHLLSFPLLWRDRLVCLAIFAIAAWAVGCYRSDHILDRFDSIYYAFIALAVTGLAQFTLVALLPVDLRMIARRELVVGGILAAALLLSWRIVASFTVCRFAALHRFFYVLGSQRTGKAVAREICKSRGARAEARYISSDDLERRMARREKQGNANGMIEEAIVILGGTDRRKVTELLGVCERHCRHTYLYPDFDDTLLFQHQNLASVAGLPLIEVPSAHPDTLYLPVKRAMDIAVALTALVALSPAFLVIAAAVGLTSPGGVFYRQERLGRHGKPFRIRKFRSMVANGVGPATDTQRATREDPRITPVGRFIRKYKLDELPQLLSVLNGEMSLIGPRPLWRTFFEENGENSPLWERRLAVRPGLTSLLHVQGHSFAKASDFLRYDLIYINNLSLMNDLRILVGTLRIVLSGKGSEA